MNAPLSGGVKWSQVTPAATGPAPTDFVLGLQNGNTDVLFTFAQLQNLIGGGMAIQPVVSASPEASHVVKTAPGSAQPVAAALDAEGWSEIVGTIGGDDTLLIVSGTLTQARRVSARIREVLG